MHAFELGKDVVLPLSGGQTFTCNGSAIPQLKSVCSASAAVGMIGAGYSVSQVTSYQTTSLF
jgi:hypothetical protein